MAQTHTTRVLIIGAGPAGYTAAIYAARGSLEPMLVAGLQPGGQLMITSDVENFPGFAEGILGPELMEQMRNQAARVGAEFLTENVTEVDFSQRPFHVKTDGEHEFWAKTAIVTTGASAKWLGLPSEMAGHVKSGASKSFAIWNPIDLGYSATMIAYHLSKGEAKAEPGATIPIGRMGEVTLDDKNEAAMADPFTYDAGNIDEFSSIF